MAFKRHLWMIKQQLLRFEEEQQHEGSIRSCLSSRATAAPAAVGVATAAAAAPPSTPAVRSFLASDTARAVVPSEFLEFLRRSHPHLLRLKPRLLDRLLESAVLDLRQQQQQQSRHQQQQQQEPQQQRQQDQHRGQQQQQEEQQQHLREHDERLQHAWRQQQQQQQQLEGQQQERRQIRENGEFRRKARRVKDAAARSVATSALPEGAAGIPAEKAPVPATPAAATTAAEAATPAVTAAFVSAAAAGTAAASAEGARVPPTVTPLAPTTGASTGTLAEPAVAAATLEGRGAAAIGESPAGGYTAAGLRTKESWLPAPPPHARSRSVQQSSLNSCLNALYSAQVADRDQQQEPQQQQREPEVGRTILEGEKERLHQQQNQARHMRQQQQKQQHQRRETAASSGASGWEGAAAAAAVRADGEQQQHPRGAEGSRLQTALRFPYEKNEQEQQQREAAETSREELQLQPRQRKKERHVGRAHAAAAEDAALREKKRKTQQQQTGETDEQQRYMEQLLLTNTAAADAVVAFPPPKDRLRDCVGLPRTLVREVDQKVFLPFALNAFYEEVVASDGGRAVATQRRRHAQQHDALVKRKEEEEKEAAAEAGEKEGERKGVAQQLWQRQHLQADCHTSAQERQRELRREQQQQAEDGRQESQQKQKENQLDEQEGQQQKQDRHRNGESRSLVPLLLAGGTGEDATAAQMGARAAGEGTAAGEERAAGGWTKSEKEEAGKRTKGVEERRGRQQRGGGFIQLSRGILISGPAGVGKTKLALAIAGELSALQQQVSFFPASLSSLCQRDFSLLPPPWEPLLPSRLQQRPPLGRSSSSGRRGGQQRKRRRGQEIKTPNGVDRSTSSSGEYSSESTESDSSSDSGADTSRSRDRDTSSRRSSRRGSTSSKESSGGEGRDSERGGSAEETEHRVTSRQLLSSDLCSAMLSRLPAAAAGGGGRPVSPAGDGGASESATAAAAAREGGARSGGREGGARSSSSAEEFLALLFEAAKTQAPSVVLLQDLSLLLQQERLRGARSSSKAGVPGRAGAGGEAAADSNSSSLTRALARELDGLYGYNVVVLGICESAESLDCGLRRSGRFDTELRLPLPDSASRYQMLQAITRGLPVAADLDFDRVVEATVGYVAADLHALVKEALYYAIIRGLEKKQKRRSICNSSSSHSASSSSNSRDSSFGTHRRDTTCSDDSSSSSREKKRRDSSSSSRNKSLCNSGDRDATGVGRLTYSSTATEPAKHAGTHAAAARAAADGNSSRSSGTPSVLIAVGASDSLTARLPAASSSLSAAAAAAMSAGASSADGPAAVPFHEDAAPAAPAPSGSLLASAAASAASSCVTSATPGPAPLPESTSPSLLSAAAAGSGPASSATAASAPTAAAVPAGAGDDHPAAGVGAVADAAAGAEEGAAGGAVHDWQQWLWSSDSVCIDRAAAEHALLSFVPSYKRSGAFLPRPSVRWAEVGGLCEAKKEVEERILFPLMFSEFYDVMGIRKPTGILLYGPPGCGKTFLAKALANACQANFIAVKGPELLSKYVGESEAALRGVFSRASFYAPCLIFFDEIDAVCGQRGGGKGEGGGGNKVEERVVAQLLTELDGISDRGKVFVVAASNRPDILDPALLRPGRLEVRVYVQLPTEPEREEILRKGWTRMQREQREERLKRRVLDDDKCGAFVADVETEGLPHHAPHTDADPEVDFAAIAKLTENYSGADLDAVLREAVLLMIQEQRQEFLSVMHESLNEEDNKSASRGKKIEMGERSATCRGRDTHGEAIQDSTSYFAADLEVLTRSKLQQGKHSCFYRRAGRMRLQQRHLQAAVRKIIPSVTAEQVQFYERYREKLNAEQKNRVILDTRRHT